MQLTRDLFAIAKFLYCIVFRMTIVYFFMYGRDWEHDHWSVSAWVKPIKITRFHIVQLSLWVYAIHSPRDTRNMDIQVAGVEIYDGPKSLNCDLYFMIPSKWAYSHLYIRVMQPNDTFWDCATLASFEDFLTFFSVRDSLRHFSTPFGSKISFASE